MNQINIRKKFPPALKRMRGNHTEIVLGKLAQEAPLTKTT